MNLRPIDYKADALTTTPSRLSVPTENVQKFHDWGKNPKNCYCCAKNLKFLKCLAALRRGFRQNQFFLDISKIFLDVVMIFKKKVIAFRGTQMSKIYCSNLHKFPKFCSAFSKKEGLHFFTKKSPDFSQTPMIDFKNPNIYPKEFLPKNLKRIPSGLQNSQELGINFQDWKL